MEHTIKATFLDELHARNAASALERDGFPRERIEMARPGKTASVPREAAHETTEAASFVRGAIAGGGAGLVVGVIAVLLGWPLAIGGALAILLAVVVGAIAGAAVTPLVGHAGAHRKSTGTTRVSGGSSVLLRAEDDGRAAAALQLLRRYDPVRLEDLDV